MNKILIDQAREKAIEVIKACSKRQGFFASGLPGGYEATWARDAGMITLGASLAGNEFKKEIEKSLDLLAEHQSELGQVPNCVGSYNLDRKSDVTFNSIDSSLWFIISHHVYAAAYKDKTLLDKHKVELAKAFLWLRYQDPNEDKLLAQQPTMDWMDAFPHKYGHVLNTQALYYGVLKLISNKSSAYHNQQVLNGRIEKYLSLYEEKLGYYLPWNWKNHDGDREEERWFDSTGNLLAIITGLATPKITSRILNHIEKEEINRPYPCKAIWPPIRPGDREWHSYFSKCDARTPYHYLNAGVWPFIGGLYVVALVKAKQFRKAEKELENLAEADMKKLQIRDLAYGYEFNEWLDGKYGKPKGEPYQGWSAGAYLYAYECLKRKKVLFFK